MFHLQAYIDTKCSYIWTGGPPILLGCYNCRLVWGACHSLTTIILLGCGDGYRQVVVFSA